MLLRYHWQKFKIFEVYHLVICEKDPPPTMEFINMFTFCGGSW